ncbi:MAG: P1 family peptidase, partial [Terriglobales bacterium]
LPGNAKVQSINPLVGETNDGYLSDIRARAVGDAQVLQALRSARSGTMAEGAVGAGSGTVAFGFKGGIGTASRRLPAALGGYTIGVLVQTNFGGILDIDGAPVGRALHQYYLRGQLGTAHGSSPDGSCMIVVATDAPLEARNLRRLAARALLGLARTGSAASNGSGDYVIAFSTAADLRIPAAPQPRTLLLPPASRLRNDAMSPLFLAAIEATQEAIYNSLFKATTTSGHGHTVQALPLPATEAILRRYHLLR